MIIILTRILTTIFSVLAIIHFYWALGGQFGFENALPTNEQGIKILNPKSMDTAMAGIVFLIFGLLYLFSLNALKNKILIIIQNIGLWVIPIIFLTRAIGDFKYLGFFKQIDRTAFADMDTKFYSPLCLIIALIGISIIKMNKKHAKNLKKIVINR